MNAAITKHIGDLSITTKAQAKRYALLDEVTGSLYIRADFQAPARTSVGGKQLVHPPIIVTGLQWPVSILDETMRIGCQDHQLTEWARFDNRTIAKMDGRNAVKFWSANRDKMLGMARDGGRVFEAAAETES